MDRITDFGAASAAIGQLALHNPDASIVFSAELANQRSRLLVEQATRFIFALDDDTFQLLIGRADSFAKLTGNGSLGDQFCQELLAQAYVHLRAMFPDLFDPAKMTDRKSFFRALADSTPQDQLLLRLCLTFQRDLNADDRTLRLRLALIGLLGERPTVERIAQNASTETLSALFHEFLQRLETNSGLSHSGGCLLLQACSEAVCASSQFEVDLAQQICLYPPAYYAEAIAAGGLLLSAWRARIEGGAIKQRIQVNRRPDSTPMIVVDGVSYEVDDVLAACFEALIDRNGDWANFANLVAERGDPILEGVKLKGIRDRLNAKRELRPLLALIDSRRGGGTRLRLP
jgi:hypothetical protein